MSVLTARHDVCFLASSISEHYFLSYHHVYYVHLRCNPHVFVLTVHSTIFAFMVFH